MKRFLLLTLIIVSQTAVAQLDQDTINGKLYYVYPHQIKLSSNYDYLYLFCKYKQVIKRDELNQKIVSSSIEPLTSREQKAGKRYQSWPKKTKKIFLNMFRQNPTYYFTDTEIELDIEPTPALESLPDGEYVIYYRDVAYVKDKTLYFKNDLVAALLTIKNNQIEGECSWFDENGKQIMTGNYLHSEKNGVWKNYEYRTYYNGEESSSKRTKFDIQSQKYDTAMVQLTYAAGVKNGLVLYLKGKDTLEMGYYKDNKEIGSWKRFAYKEKISFDKKGQIQIEQTTDKFLYEQFTYRSDSLRGKKPLIRTVVVPYSEMEYDQSDQADTVVLNNTYYVPLSNLTNEEYYGADEFPNFDLLFTLIPEKEQIELSDEEVMTYDGGEYYEYPEDYSSSKVKVGKKYYTTNQLIDSIGYLYQYEGVFERYYSNGQLQFHYEIKDGELLEESPVYWDNGNVANEIIFDTDSNQYIQRYYDYNGILYRESKYDSKGEPLKQNKVSNFRTVIVQGQEYSNEYGNPTFMYSSLKALKTDTVSERILVNEELFKLDTSIASQTWYYPQTRTLKTVLQNILHEDVSIEEVEFSEDFKNIHIVRNTGLYGMELKTIQNGFLRDQYTDMIDDTLKKYWLIASWFNYYSGEDDNELSINGNLFSGDVKIKANTNSFKVKARKSKINISLPNESKEIKLFNKSVKRYVKSEKKNDFLASFTSYASGYSWIGRTVLDLFPMLYGDMLYANSYINYNFDGYREKRVKDKEKKRSKSMVFTTVSGKMVDGKAQNKWTYLDQNGKLASEAFYDKGQLNGEELTYNIAYPKPKSKQNKKNEFNFFAENSLRDKYEKYPEKKTYFLESINHYKNGNSEGVSCKFNWAGDTLAYTYYVNDFAEGKYYERNELFYSEGMAKNGMLEGQTRTYLTVPGKDSILLFNLNFSNNLLQGESVAFHTNGKIAKKGFFLAGQPIDDYQAFDTLGNIYQYVKFQFGQPIEEKIWEENELSVRYLFDWRDSVHFNFGDITQSNSVSNLMSRMGFSNEALNKPYYGRPSLINKTGVNYEITKYYPNDTIARTGTIAKGVKTSCWKYYNYAGEKLYEVEYFDSLIKINDSVSFKSKGILYYLDKQNNTLSKNFIIEKFEKYDCSKTDHTEERMLYCFWERDTNQHRRNGYVKNYYDNGALQNEGYVKDGLPTGIWKLYDNNGNLSQVGEYNQGKRTGRWLKGDLSKIKNMSEICLNPNTENLEDILKYQANLLDVYVIYYKMGQVLRQNYYGINQNSEEEPSDYLYEDFD